jgi:hypothetical protein
VSNLFKYAPSIAERDGLAWSMLHTAAALQQIDEKKYLSDMTRIRI